MQLKSSARSDRLRREARKSEAQDRAIRRMAALLRDQEDLDRLLEGAAPDLREAMLDKIRPFLHFTPEEKITDCPKCGLHRGSVIPHACAA